MTNKVVILGSTNVDQFLTVERYAQPGYCHCTHASRHNIYY
ncbi:putative ribokinase [Staphylococcus aureus]|nr:putative ribokinase [Staphylococcus aureus]